MILNPPLAPPLKREGATPHPNPLPQGERELKCKLGVSTPTNLLAEAFARNDGQFFRFTQKIKPTPAPSLTKGGENRTPPLPKFLNSHAH